MKLSYKNQIILLIILILAANILGTLFKSWMFRSGGYVLAGLFWVIHPVLPEGAKGAKDALLWTRIAGIVLILIGVFTRSYIY